MHHHGVKEAEQWRRVWAELEYKKGGAKQQQQKKLNL